MLGPKDKWIFRTLPNTERFAKLVNGFKPVTIFAERSILDIWQGSEYAYKM